VLDKHTADTPLQLSLPLIRDLGDHGLVFVWQSHVLVEQTRLNGTAHGLSLDRFCPKKEGISFNVRLDPFRRSIGQFRTPFWMMPSLQCTTVILGFCNHAGARERRYPFLAHCEPYRVIWLVRMGVFFALLDRTYVCSPS